MSEIYKNSTHFVYLDISGGTADAPPTAVCNGVSLNVQGPELVNGVERWTAVVGLVQTQSVGELAVTWSFTMDGTPATKVDYLDVVAPLLELDDLLDEFGGEVEESDLIKAERKVRSYIESYTGQVFAPSLETVTVKATGTSVILPKRLISVTETNPVFLSGYTIENNGWGITLTVPYDYDYPGVIIAPYSNADAFYHGERKIAITGRWGWDRAPKPVQEAALLLVEDFLAPEAAYRDKYLESLTSPDWRIQFHGNAFRGTGNVRVDQLLADYVNKNRWVII